MTRDEITKLAQGAGIVVTGEAVWRLCELVAAAEREVCAKVCEAQRDARIETHPARVEFSDNAMSLRCAATIRARGEE